MVTTRSKRRAHSNDEIREIILQYLYDRNANAKSLRSDKTGAAVKISVMRKALKEAHGLKQNEVWSNLNYLISQGWVEQREHQRTVSTPNGRLIPSTTSYYIITAAGIDRIEGQGAFTMDKFRGIRIEATGQNIITVGDGNQVNARFADAAEALADLRNEFLSSTEIDDAAKIDVVGDIDSIQSQLAKPKPNRSAVHSLWSAVERTAQLIRLGEKALRIAQLLDAFV